jgi:hypothetical protein
MSAAYDYLALASIGDASFDIFMLVVRIPGILTTATSQVKMSEWVRADESRAGHRLRSIKGIEAEREFNGFPYCLHMMRGKVGNESTNL